MSNLDASKLKKLFALSETVYLEQLLKKHHQRIPPNGNKCHQKSLATNSYFTDDQCESIVTEFAAFKELLHNYSKVHTAKSRPCAAVDKLQQSIDLPVHERKDLTDTQLVDHFKNDRTHLFRLINEFVTLPPVGRNRQEGLALLYNQLHALYNFAERVNRPIKAGFDIYVAILVEKFDPVTRAAWDAGMEGDFFPDYIYVLKFLGDQAQNAKSLDINMERAQIAHNLNRCVKCFHVKHRAETCPIRSACKTCGGRHHHLYHLTAPDRG